MFQVHRCLSRRFEDMNVIVVKHTEKYQIATNNLNVDEEISQRNGSDDAIVIQLDPRATTFQTFTNFIEERAREGIFNKNPIILVNHVFLW